MPKLKFTDKAVRALRTTAAQEDYFDTEFKDGSFGLRVSSSGRKVWFVIYRFRGRQVRLKIGTYPAKSLAAARQDARDELNKVSKGRNPQAEKVAERNVESFRDLAHLYLERHAKRKKRTWQEDERKIDSELLPRWWHYGAKDITRGDVIQLVESIVDRGSPVTANRCLALISKIFSFGVDQGVVDHNPAYRIARPAREQPRDRVLSDDEVRAVWVALESCHPVVEGFYKMRLLSAQRGIEIQRMCWSDHDGKWWTIPADVSKNNLPHRVPLAPQALGILEKLKPLTGDSEWVFESPRKPGFPMTSITKTTHRIAELAKVNFTAHDLRRTAATNMASMGIDRFTIARILNHVDRGVTAIYDRATYDGEKLLALNRWDRRLKAIIADTVESEKVVNLR